VDFVRLVLEDPIYDIVEQALTDGNSGVVEEATYFYYTTIKHGLPEVVISLAKSNMLPNIFKLLTETPDPMIVRNCLSIIWELLNISNFIEDKIKDNTVKQSIDVLDAFSVIGQLFSNQNSDVSKLAEAIMVKFYNTETIS
jgi:hypothetical protein